MLVESFWNVLFKKYVRKGETWDKFFCWCCHLEQKRPLTGESTTAYSTAGGLVLHRDQVKEFIPSGEVKSVKAAISSEP